MKVRKAVAVIVHRISPKIWKQIDFVLFLEYKSKSYCLKLDPMNHSDSFTIIIFIFLTEGLEALCLDFFLLLPDL